jgi:SAM-dependent methyltransferase
MSSQWIAYNDLAWTEILLADPSDYEEDAERCVEMITRRCAFTPKTLLHLGCGAGGHDTLFKRHFAVTGVDVSRGMLDIARQRHPDVEYFENDMRSVRLERLFDAVVIPDSIDYMVTRDDLGQAIRTAAVHLRPGGVLVVVGKTSETFRDNNFAYTGEREDMQITVLENNYIHPYRPGTYEAAIVYLIREHGELHIRSECHVLGLFPRAAWEEAFAREGFAIEVSDLHGGYAENLLGGGVYPQHMFIGRKTVRA